MAELEPRSFEPQRGFWGDRGVAWAAVSSASARPLPSFSSPGKESGGKVVKIRGCGGDGEY